MRNEKPQISLKYQKIALQFLDNRLTGLDDKRHDRITHREAQAIKRAYKDGLSIPKIAALFYRDPRSVGKELRVERRGLLNLTIIEAGRRVLDFKTGEYARLIKFRIGNTYTDVIVVKKIYLEVLHNEKHDTGPRLEALVEPYKYDVELRIGDDLQYAVTEDNFKLSKNDFDDFDVLCTSQPGTGYQVRIKVDYSEYPDIETIPQYSEELYLEFPKVNKGTNWEPADHFKLIVATTSDYLLHLSDYIQKLPEIDNVVLRLYLEKPLSDELKRDMENKFSESGVNLNSPIQQESGIVRIIFNVNEALPAAIAHIKLPTLLGWQVFDSAGNHLRGMSKFDDNVAVVEEKP